MSYFKKIISFVLCFTFIFTFAACSGKTADNDSADKKLSIICTVFPEYDWVKNILGGNAENTDLTLLLDSGVDLHNYQPTVDDMVKIAQCDMFIYVGGESDKWVDDALKNAKEKLIKINLLEVLGDKAKEEEEVEGMQAEEEEEDEKEYDEHVWLSLKNAEIFVRAISEKLQSLDNESKEQYEKNTAAYLEKLSQLDSEFEAVCSASGRKTLLFGDRFPFRYMTDDYGLSYYAAFSGCSAETEASFETVSFLAQKVDELGLKTVLTIEGSDGSIARTIINNTKTQDQTVLSLNSMQGITEKDVQSGVSYLSVMEENLIALEKALEV
ncbi:MAG: metal ABC transporter substrate-binding protein [Acutalibacteraceae bacterium]